MILKGGCEVGGRLQKNAGKEEAGGWQLKSTYKILVLSALIKAYE